MLFNEPKLLKMGRCGRRQSNHLVSVLFNEPKLLKTLMSISQRSAGRWVSVLFNEPKLLKRKQYEPCKQPSGVSVLFNEPKLLKTTVIA